MQRRVDRAVASLALGVMGVGCGGGWGMAVPADVAQHSEELAIQDRSSWSGALVDEAFGLGPYKVSDVDRKWSSTRTSTLFAFSDSRTRGGYGYKLNAQDVAWQGECVTEQNEQNQQLGEGAEFSSVVAKLGCTCRTEQAEATLFLDASTTRQYHGTLKGPEYTYRITALTERDNGRMSPHDPLGYRVDGEGPVGAVGVVKPGRVWLAKGLAEPVRQQLACLFAGLLLYMPPER
jgi:hypothetical protein